MSGQILTLSAYDGVDPDTPIECLLSENWYLCTFFGECALRDAKSQAQSIKGFQVAVTDLF